MPDSSLIGHPIPPRDGRERVKAALCFAPDIQLPGMLYARFVTSPYAHVVRVEVEVARGVGEPPVIPTAFALANALADATGVCLTDLPMSAPRVRAILRDAHP